jgi:hypothetical protein
MKFLMPLLLFACANGHSQTCIIAKIENNDIIIGADSRIVSIPIRGTKNEVYNTTCKIIITDHFYFAFAGVAVTNLAIDYLKKYPKKKIRAKKVLKYLNQRITKPIYDNFATIRSANFAAYIDYLKRPILQIILAYYQKNTPRLFYIGFQADSIFSDSTFKTSVTAFHINPLPIGHIDYIYNDKYFHNKELWGKRNI